MLQVTVSPTPNPNSLKFAVAGAALIAEGMQAFGSAREAESDPLGARLFALEGVMNVFVVPTFVTVTKHPAASWNGLVEAIERILTEHIGRSGPDE
jgi:hypothetical protein